MSAFSARNVLLFSLAAEGATAAAVMVAPAAVAQLVFAAGVEGVGVLYGRLLGIGLLALVVACWPRGGVVPPGAVHAVLGYNLLAAAYLAYLGIVQPTGVLLWPAAIEHALVTLLLSAGIVAPRAAGPS